MDQLAQQAMVKQSFEHFQHIMALQQEATQVAQHRISFLYKVVLIGFFMILLAFVGTAYIMASQMHKGTDNLKIINQNMDVMSTQMLEMNDVIINMNQDMQSLDSMVRKMNSMTDFLQHITKNIVNMQQDMQKMDRNVLNVHQEMQQMNQEFYHMQGSIQQMDQRVHTLSKPMRLFNSMNPFH